MERNKYLLVTVGSTRFDELIQALICKDAELFTIFTEKKITRIDLQVGKSLYDDETLSYLERLFENKIKINVFEYKTNLNELIKQADLIISHAGSGSIIDSLRLNKKVIVVINSNLMDNHQAELAKELEEQKYLITTFPKTLKEAISILDMESESQFKPFPKQKIGAFQTILEDLLK